MKKSYFILSVLCSITVCSWSQTQQGIVKTKGRMVNGKYRKGEGLSGAAVTIQGRSSVLSQAGGVFSFPIPSKSFLVQGVQKKGYQLVDADATRKAYQYSSNPLYLLMETPGQQMDDKLAAERKIRRTLERQLQQREDELEELKAQNKLTQEEYRKAIQHVYEDRENNDKLIADMAKEYAQMDYDQMDELSQRISDAILDGRLTEADSLLRSKGDMSSRIAVIKKEQDVESRREAELAREQADLAKSKAGTRKKLEDAAADCYSFFNRFKLASQHDSAAYYIKLRASLDTTNAKWLNEAGKYLFDYMDDKSGARKLFISALYHAQHTGQGHNDMEIVTYNNLASTYYSEENDNKDYILCKGYYEKALDITKELYGEDHIYAAVLYNNLGMLSYILRHVGTNDLFSKALSILEQEKNSSDITIIGIYNNLGSLSYEEGSYMEAYDYYKKAVKACDRICNDDQPIVAVVYNNIGNTLGHLDKYAEAADYLSRSIAVREKILGGNHSQTISSYNNMGVILYRQKEYEQARQYYQRALLLQQESNSPISYLGATINNNMGLLSYDNHHYSEAIPYFMRAIELTNDEKNKKHFSVYQNNIASAYYELDNYEKSLEHYLIALENCSDKNAKLRANISCIYNLMQDYAHALEFEPFGYDIFIASLYEQLGDYANALEVLKRILSLDRLRSALPVPPPIESLGNDVILLYHNTVDDNEIDSNYIYSLDYYKKLLENRIQSFGEKNINTAIAYGNLATCYYQIEDDKEKAQSYYQKSINIKKELLGEQHPSIAISYILFGHMLDREDDSAAINYYIKARDIIKSTFKDCDIIDYLDYEIHGPSYEVEEVPQVVIDDPDVATTLKSLADQYRDNQRFAESETVYKEALEIYRHLASSNPLIYEPDIAKVYGNMSFIYIFMKEFAKAEQFAREGISLAPTENWIVTNLAAALLFQGKYAEAEKFYRQYKNKLKGSFLDDFEQFTEAGVIPKEREAEVERMKKLLLE